MENEPSNDDEKTPAYESAFDEVRALMRITGKALDAAEIIRIQEKYPKDRAAEFEADVIRAQEMEREYEEGIRQKAYIQEELDNHNLLEHMRKAYNNQPAHSTIATQPKTDQPSAASEDAGKKHRKKTRGKLIPPLQFYQNVLIDANNKQSLPLPRKLALVLRIFFDDNPANESSKKQLYYDAIADVYGKEQIRNEIAKKTKRKATENEIERLYEDRLKEKGPAFFAHQFARDFRKELHRYEIDDEAVFGCARETKNYYLIDSAWHATKALKNKAAAGKGMPDKSQYENLGDPKGELD